MSKIMKMKLKSKLKQLKKKIQKKNPFNKIIIKLKET